MFLLQLKLGVMGTPHVQELDPFPNLPYFEPMQALHTELCAGRSLADDFVQVHFCFRSCHRKCAVNCN